MWSIVDVSPALKTHEDHINVSLDAVKSRILKISDLQAVGFQLKANKKGTSPISGIGGACYDTDMIRLYFDPRNPNMDQHLDEALERLVAHLYFLALRWAGPGYGAKLGSALASQGLAFHFREQLYGLNSVVFDANYTEEELLPWREKAYENFEARDHGHAKWFFGAGGYPPCLGQILSYDMVGRYLRHHPQATALSLAHTPFTVFQGSLMPGAS